MKIFYQAATQNPRDWVQVEDTLWQNTPDKGDPVEPRTGGVPVGDSLLNNAAGWLFDLNVQGVSFGTVDHCHVENVAGACVVTVWNDDAYWYPPGRRNGRIWTFQPVGENTDQSFTLFADTDLYAEWAGQQLPQGMTLSTWAAFVPPAGARVRHGIWVSDPKWEQLVNRQTLHGFREWIV